MLASIVSGVLVVFLGLYLLAFRFYHLLPALARLPKLELTALVASTCLVSAQVQFTQSTVNLGLALATVTNGSTNDLLLQLQAPSSAGWAGVAIGSQMRNSLFFIIYPAANNGDLHHSIICPTPANSAKGITVSVRGATGNVQPQQMMGAPYEVIASSMTSGIMSANIRYYGTTWSTGTVDVNSTSQPWIWAVGPGTAVASDSLTANLLQHRNGQMGNFALNMAAARSNVAAVSTATSALPSSASNTASDAFPSATTASSATGSSFPAVSTGPTYPGAGASIPSDDLFNGLLIAHATLLPLVFVVLLPLGLILLRAMPTTPIRAHYLVQGLSLLLALAGLGLAVAYSTLGYGAVYNQYHQIIGIIVVSLLVLQAAGGILHHLDYKRKQTAAIATDPELSKSGRTPLAHVHMWLGRLVILLGGINAVLGFVLAGSTPGAIAIGVCTLVVYIVVGVAVVFAGRKQRKKVNDMAMDLNQTYSESNSGSAKHESYQKKHGI